MKEKLALFWWRFRERRDDAWQDGYRQHEADVEEYIFGKEAWIAQCEYTISELLTRLTDDQWRHLPVEVQEHLRSFA